MATKRIKVKVTQKKISFKKIFIALVLLLCLILFVAYIIHIPVKNIYISGNNILSDKEIIELSNLENYPPYINTYFINIKERLTENDYIKNIKIKRKLLSKIYIEVEEYKPIAIYKDKLILSSKKKVENDHKIEYVPYIINNIEYQLK